MERFLSREEKYLPKRFYNIKADLPEPPKPALHPGTGKPLTLDDWKGLFSTGFAEQEMSTERWIPIPEEVLQAYRQFRPTPLVYASGLRRHLGTKAHIFYKYEGVSPTGSHKSNTAFMQAYLASKQGIKTLSTETGAGQWGSALAHAGSFFGIKILVFMVRVSSREKPGRKVLMQLFGAKVEESPSNTTDAGRKFYRENPDHPGSLGIAISEAVELAVKNGDIKYSLGSVLDAVLMHQTIIGLEAEQQLADVGVYPDVVIGCVGGGSNFSGISFPFVRRNLVDGKKTRFVAVEPESCPTLTKGELRYDHGDAAGMTPLVFMHTLGKDFIPPTIHAGGLRYHGMAPLVSHLNHMGIVEAQAYPQEKAFAAANLFLKTEGILAAPESSHAIAAAIDEAKRATSEKVILFNLSGHGFLDLASFEKMNGK